jgi:hypothetical protein
MTFPFAHFVSSPLLLARSGKEARLVRAVRLWVVLNKLERPYGAAVEAQLGRRPAALALDLLMMRVGVAWPEAFIVNPPCCPRMTHDEALILAMVEAGVEGDRLRFDGLLQEMLPADTREALFQAATHLADTLSPARISGQAE